HSDQGWHYQHKAWVKALKDNHIFQSMSRKGNCYDNSPMENFFGLLKQEMFYGEEFNSYEELELEIHKYINYYNNVRRKVNLKGK
ncbi:IS3 family transposase, partial [Staphylococcus canis]